MSVRLAIDIGGTFTDATLIDEETGGVAIATLCILVQAVVMLVLFYFASLFLAGILYRAGQKMWVVYVVSLTGGPVMVIAASWLWRLLH